ncbi:MAG: GGDEF domain-containing protein, partial [Phycisphaerae bacterium]
MARLNGNPDTAAHPSGGAGPVPPASPGRWVTCLSEVAASFSRWLEEHAEDEHVWPSFDRFVRETLLDLIGATRVRLFRVADGGRALRPLTEAAGSACEAMTPTGLVEHVLATGRRYIRGDWTHGELLDLLADQSRSNPLCEPTPDDSSTTPSKSRPAAALAPGSPADAPAWLFPIRGRNNTAHPDARGRSSRSIGLVAVGEALEHNLADREALDALANLINAFWLHVRDVQSLHRTRRTDHASGVLNRTDFLDAAQTATDQAQQDGEPVLVMALAIEGLRRLDDEGHWTLRDRLIRQTGNTLRSKLRNDDLVGRFSDDRFVALLRRLDLALGRLVSSKAIQSIRQAVAGTLNETFPQGGAEYVRIRCGLASSSNLDGPQPPTLREL